LCYFGTIDLSGLALSWRACRRRIDVKEGKEEWKLRKREKK
jgi:hypothetical protein